MTYEWLNGPIVDWPDEEVLAEFYREYSSQFTPPKGPTNMKAIMIFGPKHGQNCEVNYPPPQQIAMLEDAEIDWGPTKPGPPEPGFTHVGRHMYELQDTMTNNNGEDCVVYVHDINCCEKTMDAKTPDHRGPQADYSGPSGRQHRRDERARFGMTTADMYARYGGIPQITRQNGKLFGLSDG